MNRYVHITMRHGLGDAICMLSACREYIRRTGDALYVDDGHVPCVESIIESYGDNQLRHGDKGHGFPLDLKFKHGPLWQIDTPDFCFNYLGIYYTVMQMVIGKPPVLDLPVFERESGVAVIAPFSNYAKNPSLKFVQGVVDIFKQQTGMDVFVVGKTDTPRNLKGVSYDLLKDDAIYLMKTIQNAKFVLSPRTSVSHLAAGYGIPSYIWYPDDGWNWHTEGYTGWSHSRSLWRDGLKEAERQMESFLGGVNHEA